MLFAQAHLKEACMLITNLYPTYNNKNILFYFQGLQEVYLAHYLAEQNPFRGNYSYVFKVKTSINLDIKV